MNEREDLDLKAFASDLLEELSQESGPATMDDAFTRYVLEQLVDAGESLEPEVCFHQGRGFRVNGYEIAENRDRLDLFGTVFYEGAEPPKLPSSELDLTIKRLKAFLNKVIEHNVPGVVQPSPQDDMVNAISNAASTLRSVRLFVLTNGTTVPRTIPSESWEGFELSVQVWDLRRLFRLANSSLGREPLEIDLAEIAGGPIPCLPAPGATAEYRAYLLVVPGRTLAELYERFGARLLERNVRAFLQTSGKVNKQIRDTIRNRPDRFFAYNNGISATASDVAIDILPGGGAGIRWIRDLQIVNGGQTTASIHAACYRQKLDVDGIAVPAKLSVVGSNVLDELVPLISRFANNQTKVSEADLSSNDPFQVQMERLSRTCWAPPAPGQTEQTIWFYERARGQYADEKARQTSTAARRRFSATHPPRQRFTKGDLAKFENSWNQYPHIVSRGSEKNFVHFVHEVKRTGPTSPDETYFRRAVAKAFLFRRAERLIHELELGGYRANVVTYSIALLSHRTARRIDLDGIWRKQALLPVLEEALRLIALSVHPVLTSAPGGRNITEWCKQPDCWERVKEVPIDLPDLSTALLPLDAASAVVAAEEVQPEQAVMEPLRAVPPSTWLEVAAWARQTGSLREGQRVLAERIGESLTRGEEPPPAEILRGLMVLAEAEQLGFLPMPKHHPSNLPATLESADRALT